GAGQKRLTTLYILLPLLEKNYLPMEFSKACKKSLFSMTYETRDQSAVFLQNIKPSCETNNIDFFHIAKAYEVVSEWFSDKDFNEANQLLATLLAKPESKQSVKVIWYDLTDECI